MSSGNPISLRTFAESWWTHWGASGTLKLGELPYRRGEVMRYVPGPNLLTVGNHNLYLPHDDN